MPYYVPQLEKQPSESLLYDMDFTGRLASGVTIVSVTSVDFTPDDVVDDDFDIGGAVPSGTRIQFRCSDGTAGTKYKITAVVVDSAGNTLEGEGYLFILDT